MEPPMTKYSAELKEQMVRRMMPPTNQSVAAIRRETGISAPTLYAWKRQFRDQGHLVPSKPGAADQWDGKAKLTAVIHTALMNEVERAAYCREHGLYAEQLDAWKAAFEAMEGTAPVDRGELARERQKSRQLAKELQRKEKALAEAAALLTLSKKARAIWGTDADD
jgi:transposase-like protein